MGYVFGGIVLGLALVYFFHISRQFEKNRDNGRSAD